MSDIFSNALGYFLPGDKNDPRVNPQLRQRIALALMQRQSKYPKNVGEGLSAIGEAIGDRRLMRSLEEGDLAQQAVMPPAALSEASEAPAAATPGYAPPDDTAASSPAVAAINSAASNIPPIVPAQAPGRGFTPVPMSAGQGEMIEPGEYNAIDAADPRNRYKPIPAYLQLALERNIQDPERRAYLGQLAGKEAQSAGEVSSTGAAGPFQFTRGTGAQYGIPGNARLDPDASTLAANAFTDDNAKALTARLGREPTPGELALAHQQGAGTAGNMLTGAGNASASNLAVNNVPPGMGPQAAAQKVMGYYGMPGAGVTTPGPRDAAATALMAQAQPQGRPSVADYGQPLALAATPQPNAGIQPAPPATPPIRPAPQPQQQVAQAQPQAIPGFVPPPPGAPQGVPIIKMSPREAQLTNWLNAEKARGNPYAEAKANAAGLQDLQNERITRQNAANEMYKAQIARDTEQFKLNLTGRMDQSKRIQDLAEQQQKLIGGGTAAPAVDPRVLGTPQSPQRTGIPTVPPVPPGITPQQWAEKQAPEMVKAVSAVEKATPQFKQMMDLIQQAENHPGKEWGVGPLSSVTGHLPSAVGFKKIMEQIGGQNFLNVYQQLKGGGSITEIEGSKAEAAQARLSTAQNKEDFNKAMDDFKNAIRQDLETVQRKVNQPVTAWQRSPNDEPAPDIGQIGVRKGKPSQYIGGNPAVDSSYRDVR